MDRDIVGKHPTFHRDKRNSNSFRILLWLALIVAAMAFMLRVNRGEVEPLFQPTPTATRLAHSYVDEALAYFRAGRIDDPNTDNDAIDTYYLALQENPEDAETWAELARILTYSSALLSSQEQSRLRMEEALEAIDKAIELNPDISRTHAIRAFVLDWGAPYYSEEEGEDMLTEAYNNAVRSIQLDPNDAMALAFYAEVLLDQENWSQAEQYAKQAVALDDGSMDAHRVYATVLETLGFYRLAIEQYQKATEITPNLTFLYIQIGVNYRYLAMNSNSEMLYNEALANFDRAVMINDSLGVKDPLPYIAIAKAYSQMGEFFIAARNAEKALSLDPTDANTYGQLGIIYFKSKNYESSMPALQCAVVSCSASENLVLERLANENPDWGVQPVAVEGLQLDSVEVAYYYAEYGQVLAYLSRPRLNYCNQAMPVLRAVRESYSDDDVLMEIVEGSESTCQSLGVAPVP